MSNSNIETKIIEEVGQPTSGTSTTDISRDSQDPNIGAISSLNVKDASVDEIGIEPLLEKQPIKFNEGPSTKDTQNTNGLDSQKYRLKIISWRGKFVPIVTQNKNGPCPLIAIVNVLLLRGKITIPCDLEYISFNQLMDFIGNILLENPLQVKDETTMLNYQQNMQDAIDILPKLNTGLDVNVKFTCVKNFEYTPECIVFDLLNISLYHGWLVDPQEKELFEIVSNLGYNQFVEMIIENRSSKDEKLVTKSLIAQQFLETTASQLTYHGLCELNTTMRPDELAVLFRNNHFSTIFKKKNRLYQLVTDQGFLQENNVIWETLTNIDGSEVFVDGNFSEMPLKINSNIEQSQPKTEGFINPTTSANMPTLNESRKRKSVLAMIKDFIYSYFLTDNDDQVPNKKRKLQ